MEDDLNFLLNGRQTFLMEDDLKQIIQPKTIKIKTMVFNEGQPPKNNSTKIN